MRDGAGGEGICRTQYSRQDMVISISKKFGKYGVGWVGVVDP